METHKISKNLAKVMETLILTVIETIILKCPLLRIHNFTGKE